MTLPSVFEYFKKNYIVACSGFFILICFVINFVRSEQVERLEADYDDLNVRHSRVIKNFKYGSDLESDLEEMREMEKEGVSRLFRPENLAVNQRYFYEIESATGVTLRNLQQIVIPAPTGKGSKKARKKAAKLKYRSISYSMAVNGTYEQVLNFLKEIEGGDAFVRLNGLVLNSSRSKDGVGISLRLGIEVLGVKS